MVVDFEESSDLAKTAEKENVENILHTANLAENIAKDVHKLRAETIENFYMLTNKLSTFQQINREIAEFQNRNWKVLQEQMDIFEQNIHLL